MTKTIKRLLGVLVLVLALWYLSDVISGPELAAAARALLSDPVGLALALLSYTAAFALRSWSWTRVLPSLPFGQSWAAIHVSLLGNHVLPLRLGEALRVTSVLRRTSLTSGDVIASTIAARSADLLAVLTLAALAAPTLIWSLTGWWLLPLATLLLGAFALALFHPRSPLRSVVRSRTGQPDLPRTGQPDLPRTDEADLSSIGSASRHLTPRGSLRSRHLGLTGLVLIGCAGLAWVLEAAVVWEVARLAGVGISAGEAVAVTAVTIAVQTVAITPGGIGSYEAAATAALTTLGVPPGPAFAVALLTHAVKTVYSLAIGGLALVSPAPGYFGRLRLPRNLPPRPDPLPISADAPIVVFIPPFNEEATITQVLERLPRSVAGREVITLVIDDGSTDDSAALAAQAGARVLRQPRNLGLGAAVRRGLTEAAALNPAASIYLDADLEYFPEDLESLAAPILNGTADYVICSRFAGTIERMLPHRRFGNRVLTVWVRWLTRRRDLTDGQSGYRAFSPRATTEAEVIHDYNYAQVLTLDLLAKGFTYTEVPIRYAFRQSGESFIKLGHYLRKVIPAVHRELNS